MSSPSVWSRSDSSSIGVPPSGSNDGFGSRLGYIGDRLVLRAQHAHDVQGDFGGVAAKAILPIPLTASQSSLDVDQLAAAQVLSADDGRAATRNQRVVLDVLHLVTVLIFGVAVGR